MRECRLVALMAVVSVAAFVAGCGGPPGIPQAETVPVTLEVTKNGKPLATGTVLFVPDRAKGCEGRASHGVISQGKVEKLTTYEDGDGVIAGWHTVRVHSMKGEDPQTAKDEVPKEYNTATTLSYEVKAGQPNHFKIDLVIPEDKK